jgi:ATP-binding cassette subfamily C (CFTR/MRP) protein 4
MTVPVSNCISRNNGGIISNINVFKDKRVQATSEIIEGIRFIKLYGWEEAFRRIIQGIRDQEIRLLRKLSLGRSL